MVENNYLANGKPEEKIMPSTSKALAQLAKTEQKKSHVNKTTTIHKQLPKVALVEASSTVTQLTEAAPVIAKEDVANNQAADASLTNVKEGKTTTLASTEKTE
ncbi:MAG: hypothetical protein ACKO96_20010, partial [Flammeovirgaceae bacterium]